MKVGKVCIRLFFWVLLIGSGQGILHAQEEDYLSQILYLTGAGEVESLDLQVLERYAALHTHPVRINLAPRGKLQASGLFTPYQIAVMEDYRARNGDILSILELAYLDGFGEEMARALEPFVSFASPGLDPDGSSRFSSGKLEMRAARNHIGWAEAVKFQYDHREKWRVGFACSNTSGHVFWPLERAGGYLVYNGRYRLGQLIIGDFHARFGQGLGLWSGFSIRGLTGTNTFYRRPTGLSASTSYSDAHFRGVAADFNWGRWTLSSAWAWPSLPMVNLAWYGRNGQFSLTGFSHLESEGAEPFLGRLAADFRYCLKGTSFWGEAAWDCSHLTVAALGGVVFNLGYQKNISLVARWYPAVFYHESASPVSMHTHPEDEIGVGIGCDISGYVFAVDGALHPYEEEQALKVCFSKEWKWENGFALVARATDRFRYEKASVEWQNRVSLRLEEKYAAGRFLSVWRTEISRGEGIGLMTYLEGGYKEDRMSMYLRASAFKVDHWSDRIYVYEREAPGSFNVPACYGRGWSASINFSYRLQWRFDRIKFYLRAGVQRFPWMQEEEKPGKAELKIQVSYDF